MSQASKLPSARITKNTDGLVLLQMHDVILVDRRRQNIGVHNRSHFHKAKILRPIDKNRSGINGLRSALNIGPS